MSPTQWPGSKSTKCIKSLWAPMSPAELTLWPCSGVLNPFGFHTPSSPSSAGFPKFHLNIGLCICFHLKGNRVVDLGARRDEREGGELQWGCNMWQNFKIYIWSAVQARPLTLINPWSQHRLDHSYYSPRRLGSFSHTPILQINWGTVSSEIAYSRR